MSKNIDIQHFILEFLLQQGICQFYKVKNMENSANKSISESSKGSDQKKGSILGYQIAEIRQASEKAIQEAYDLVVKARHQGAKIRIWSAKASKTTESLAEWAFKIRTGVSAKSTQKRDMEGKIQELAHHESRVLKIVHRYLDSVFAITQRLKNLNPPLNQSQLQPFLDAVTEDKRQSILALDVLTDHLERLIKNKVDLCRSFEKLTSE